jgi:calcineurin-like phosphoesterase family protein
MAASGEYVQEIISRYRQAAQANLQSPGRVGSVVVLAPEFAADCLITGDLHGHVANFEAILRRADLAAHPRRHLILQEVCHGGPTYPNGGCRSFEMLEHVAQLKIEYPAQVHFLLSNHELSELTDYPILKAKKMLNLVFRLGLQEAYGDAADEVRDAYCDFLASCPLAVRFPNGIFVTHSLPEHLDRRSFDRTVFDRPYDPHDLAEHGDVFDLVWGRDHRPDNAHAFAAVVGAKILVHGHEPCPLGYSVPNDTQLILDCCGENACCALLPVNDPVTHADVVARVESL